MKNAKLFTQRNLILLIGIVLSGVFVSPKWGIAALVWLHYILLLRYFRDQNWRGFLLAIPVLALTTSVAQYEVFPMDFISLVIFMLVASTIGLIPFLIDRLAHHRIPSFLSTLVFPTIFTLFNALMDAGPQGTWSNAAYTQYNFLPLMQIAAITGIYGINFLMAWAASTVNYLWEQRQSGQHISRFSWAMPGMMALVLVYGFIRMNTTASPVSTTRMAAIMIDDFSVAEEMVKVTSGVEITLPSGMSQSDPLMQEVSKGMMTFMADPSSEQYVSVYDRIDESLERYLAATREAANKGAKVISWPESAVINIKSREQLTAEEVARVADELDIYLFFPTAVFHPEKVGKEDLFIENKVLTFSPEGELINTYFKNIPVMGVEPSFPGDGSIPVIETPYGNLSPIICYDADHPQLISQVSDLTTDLLVVPTGDWKAISPYHTWMAAVRCIENGVSMLKPASNGLSAVIDDRGRILASYDYFDEVKVKQLVFDTPVQSSDTTYAWTAPMFLQLLWGLAAMLFIRMLYTVLSKRIRRKSVRETDWVAG